MRSPLSDQESRAFLDQHKQPGMSEETKLDFRKARDEWATEGHLPEWFGESDIPAIENEVRQRVGLMMEQLHAIGQADPEKLDKFLLNISSLHKKGLIGDAAYREAIGTFSRAIPKEPRE